jgi:glycosyltransferase involved in cell wall biosynthesis
MFKNKKQIKIGIDARFYGPIGKGLGRYTQEIADNVIKISSNSGDSIEYIIFLRQENFDEFVCDGVYVKKVLAPVRWYSLAEQILMPFYIWRERLDLAHFPHFNVPVLCPAKFVITVHDLILTKFPTMRATTFGPFFYKIKNLFYKITIWLAVKRAKKIIAVSRFTKNDIVDHFKINPEKIEVIYEGVANLANGRDSLFAAKSEAEETLLRYNINEPFLLYVGNAYPHKNLEGLVEVFGEIIKNSLPLDKGENKRGWRGETPPHPTPLLSKERGLLRLVLVGKEDYFYKRLKEYARELGLWQENDLKNSRVVFPGYVPDAQLEILYKRALVYVFPSFYEGFGLPPLEAMAKGCPVVSSDKTSMPEVLGDAAIYFNPENKEEMRVQIEKIISDENLRAELVKNGYEQVKKYSWWEAGRETLGVYREVLG